MGKDVVGFSEGDRVVADVGITVSPSIFLVQPRSNTDVICSVETASIAAAARPSCARTSTLVVSRWTVDLRITLHSAQISITFFTCLTIRPL